MQLDIGISPCPNDTFIFDALVNGKINTQGLNFRLHLADVQTLNEWALQGRLPITKISYGVLAKIRDRYNLLSAGSALGRGVGPLLIGSNAPLASLSLADLQQMVAQTTVAIPGEHTTAHQLFRQAFPTANRKIFMPFQQIEAFVQQNQGLGVIIHENRFTYQQKGLHCWADLGQIWEQQTGLPIPLGGIVMLNRFDKPQQQLVDGLIQQSLQFAWARYPELSDFVTQNAQEMEESVMRKHIELYVNEYTMQLGEAGEKAVAKFVS